MVTLEIHNQNLQNQSSPTFINEIISFLANPQNKNKKLRGLNYSEITQIAFSLILASYPEIDPETLTPNQIAQLLQEIVTQPEKLESVVPQNIKELLSEFQEAQNQNKEIQQNALKKVKEFTQKQQLLIQKLKIARAYQEKIQSLADEIAQNLTSIPKPEPQIVNSLNQKLPPNENLVLEFHKIETLPPEEKESALEKLSLQIREEILSTASTTGIPRKSLDQLYISPSEIPFLAQELSLPPEKRKRFSSWLERKFSPQFTPQEAQKIPSTIVSSLVQNLPEVNSKKLPKISEQEFGQIQEQTKGAIITAIAENSLALKDLSPSQISQIIASSLPQTPEQLTKFSPLLSVPKEQRIAPQLVLFSSSTFSTTTPTTQPKIFASLLDRAAEANPLLVPDENTQISFISQLENKLFAEGITPKNAPQFKSSLQEQWSKKLALQGISPEDIDYTIQKLLQEGENPSSPRIKELEEVKKHLLVTLKNLPPEAKETLRQIGNKKAQEGKSFVTLPSQYQTAIFRVLPFNPKLNLKNQFQNLLSQIFGRKTLVLPSGQTISVSRFSSLFSSISSSFKRFFFHTKIGKQFETFFKNTALKSFQTLWSSVKTGIKQTATKAASKILIKIGLQAAANTLAPVIGTIIAFAAEKIIKGGFKLLKKLGQWVSSGFGIANAVFEGLTGQREIPEDESLSFLIPLFILFLPILFFTFFFIKTTTDSAFIIPGKGNLEGNLNIPPPSNPQCAPSRHLAEEIICILSTGSSPCNHYVVNKTTWPEVSHCLNSSNIPRKENVSQKFWGSVSQYHNLQCVGFVAGVEAAFGREFTQGYESACDYLHQPLASGYQLVNKKDIKPGDLAVWDCKGSSSDGHIAVVIYSNIEVIPETGDIVGNFSIAEANGKNGVIAVRENIPITSPGGFIRYTGK